MLREFWFLSFGVGGFGRQLESKTIQRINARALFMPLPIVSIIVPFWGCYLRGS